MGRGTFAILREHGEAGTLPDRGLMGGGGGGGSRGQSIQLIKP